MDQLLKAGSVLLLVVGLLINVGCGGGSSFRATSQASRAADPLDLGAAPGPLGSTTAVPIQVRLGSEPNVRIVSLSLEMDSLKATNSGAGNIDLIQQPFTFEFTRAGAVTVPVSAFNIYQDSYSALVFPDMTGQAVFYDSVGNRISQSITVPAQTVPASFVAGESPVVLNIFVDLSQTFTVNDYFGHTRQRNSMRQGNNRRPVRNIGGAHSSLSVNQLTITTDVEIPNPAAGQPETGAISFLVGTVSSVDTQNQIMTVDLAQGNTVQVSYATDGSTSFANCDPSSLASSLVKLDGVTEADGTIFTTSVTGLNTTDYSEVAGQINGYAPEGDYWNLILDSAAGANVSSSLVGTFIAVDPGQASSAVETGNLDPNQFSDLYFDNSHVFPGQFVELEYATLNVPDPNSSNAGYYAPLMLDLEQQTISGTVSGYTYDSGSQTGSFTLVLDSHDPLLVMNPSLTGITVRQVPQTNLRNLSSISENTAVKVRGLLFADPNCDNSNYESDNTIPVSFIMVAGRISQ